MENLPSLRQNNISKQNSLINLDDLFILTDKYIDEDNDLSLKTSSSKEFLDLFWHVEIMSRHRQKEFSAHTLRAYRNDGNSLLEFLYSYGIDLKDVGFTEVKAYSTYINQKYAIKTAIRKLDFFRRILLFGYKTHYYPKDFSVWIEKPISFSGHYSSKDVKDQRKSDNKNKAFIKPRELSERDAKITIEYFEDIVKDTPRNKSFLKFLKTRNRLIGWLLFATGMRASEITSLTFGSFYEEDDVIYVQVVGKGLKQRSIPILSRNLMNALEEHKSNVKNKYEVTERSLRKLPLLFSPVGIKQVQDIKHMSYNNLYKIVKEAVNLAEKNPDVSPHWFRHTYITFLLEQNVPLATVMDNAGHSNIATTNVYLETISKKKKHKHMSHVKFD